MSQKLIKKQITENNSFYSSSIVIGKQDIFVVRVITTHLTLTYRVHKNMYSLVQLGIRLLFYLYTPY